MRWPINVIFQLWHKRAVKFSYCIIEMKFQTICFLQMYFRWHHKKASVLGNEKTSNEPHSSRDDETNRSKSILLHAQIVSTREKNLLSKTNSYQPPHDWEKTLKNFSKPFSFDGEKSNRIAYDLIMTNARWNFEFQIFQYQKLNFTLRIYWNYRLRKIFEKHICTLLTYSISHMHL